jgi:hypothetical protein
VDIRDIVALAYLVIVDIQVIAVQVYRAIADIRDIAGKVDIADILAIVEVE